MSGFKRGALAWAEYGRNYEKTGWYDINLRGTDAEDVSDEEMAFAVGYLEVSNEDDSQSPVC